MFNTKIKTFFLKNKYHKKRNTILPEVTTQPVKSVGIILDTLHFEKKDELLKELQKIVVSTVDFKILCYANKSDIKNNLNEITFLPKDISLMGEIKNNDVASFLKYPFDLLINYYNQPNIILQFLTSNSKAKFKIGFFGIDTNLNHFMINTPLKNHQEFVQLAQNYLTILKKL